MCWRGAAPAAAEGGDSGAVEEVVWTLRRLGEMVVAERGVAEELA